MGDEECHYHFMQVLPSLTTCINSALPGTRAPKGNFEMPTKFTVWNDARKVTNETSFASAPPGAQPRTPSRPGPQRMGPSSASRMRFDPSVSSESPRVGVEHPVCLLWLFKEEKQKGWGWRHLGQAGGSGGGRRGGGCSRAAGRTHSASRRCQDTTGSAAPLALLASASVRGGGCELFNKSRRAAPCCGRV